MIRDLGPEREEERELRLWFDEQERRNLERLEEGAKAITQLVTGLYGVLFAVFAFGDSPSYLALPAVRWFGLLAVLAFFGSLLAALAVQYPWRTSYQEDNLSEMRDAYRTLRRHKAWGLRGALWSFVLGIGCFAALIFLILWHNPSP